ncbi:glutathione S-transferase family protein [Curvivirga sp.]|uniref:glutathione S-transferase family protein n=1 Tax=Curvivirga sp. TaxID=2856848 RepID=UPI003B5B4CB5
MNAVTLIGPDYSSYLRSVRIALEEKGVPYEISMNGMTEFSDLKSAKHLKLHPFGKVPVLLHGDHVIFETCAILEYVDENFVGRNLMSGTAKEFALHRAWMSAASHYAYELIIREYVVPLLRKTLPEDVDPRKFALENISKVQDVLKPFEHAYTHGNRYLTSDEPGLADCVIVIIVDYLSVLPTGTKILEPFENLRNMLEAFKKRESFRKSIPEALLNKAA